MIPAARRLDEATNAREKLMETGWRLHGISLGLLILRVGLGAYLFTHGWPKLQMLLAGEGGQFADPMGVGPTASLFLIMSAEVFCAALVIVGLGTRFFAIPIVIGMGVAAFVAHGDDPWTMGAAAELYAAGEADSWASKEPALLYFIPFAALIFTGPGRFSLDTVISVLWRGRQGDAPQEEE